MYHTVFKAYLTILGVLFSLTACADTPESPIDARTNEATSINQNTNLDSTTILDVNVDENEPNSYTTNALKYTGRDAQGRSCDLYITLVDDREDSIATDGLRILTKLDYSTLDGHRPKAGFASFFQFDGSTGSFLDENAATANTLPVLFSMDLKNNAANADANLLNNYIQEATLEQYVRIEFDKTTDKSIYTQVLESLLEGDLELNNQISVVDSIQLISLGMAHGDHYHFPTCLSMTPESLVETQFNLDNHNEHSHH